ncbi:MAG: 30S ribosome-binding factor RbfA [Actinomycetota bacterium]|nr:30S ribosome-binding factor RbfA [Actinomycetota bacterium]
MVAPDPRSRPARPYSRLDRVNEVLREVVADELERVDDDRLALVTVTGVRVDADLRHAVVWFSSLSGTTTPDDAAGVLGEHRARLQGAVGRQMRLKRTPELIFRPDPAIAVGSRVEEILQSLKKEDSGMQIGGERDSSGLEEEGS